MDFFMQSIKSANRCNVDYYYPSAKIFRSIQTVSYAYFCLKIYFVRTVHFGMKLYNERNAQVFYLFIYLLLPYMFQAFF
jgi:hypothetical protein